MGRTLPIHCKVPNITRTNSRVKWWNRSLVGLVNGGSGDKHIWML